MITSILTTTSGDTLDSKSIISFLLALGITIIFYEIYPLIRIVIMKKKYDSQEAKKMAKWNSIIVCFVTFLVAIIFFEEARNNPSAAMSIPAGYLYYLINKKVWVSKNSNKEETKVQTEEKKKKEDIQKTENKDSSNGKFVCSACGAIVKETATKCPKCGETFDDDIRSDFDKKAADLRKLKQLLDDKIITKKEFEEEKGKILK